MNYDLAIVGSGFGGSLLAMVARRLGLSVLLLERGRHPRFAIGESTSPLANLLLEQLADRYDLPRLRPLAAFGDWQRAYPDIGCGLKRGFTFFHHRAGHAFQNRPDRSDQLLVAASPHDDLADTHWLRADVDHFLVDEAQAVGVEYWDETHVAVRELGAAGATLECARGGETRIITAWLLVDATGPRGFLSKTLKLPETKFAEYPATQALYTHFTDVRRCDSLPHFAVEESPPYPRDDAAVHHVFDGGWMWILRVGKGRVSAGIAVTDTFASEIGLSDGAPAWERFLARFPTLGAQFADARPVEPFVYVSRVAYRTSRAAGPGWAMLPSAAAFVDPLFSTGIPLTLLGIERLGHILAENLDLDSGALGERLAGYAETTLAEADAVAVLIGSCYAAMPQFELFAAQSQFYFAAASFSEMARRVENPALVRRFLASDHAAFSSGLRRCARRLRGRAETLGPEEIAAFAAQVQEAISCLNVAGLSDPRKRNWYPANLHDVVVHAAKLGLTPAQMRRLLETAPWARGPVSRPAKEKSPAAANSKLSYRR